MFGATVGCISDLYHGRIVVNLYPDSLFEKQQLRKVSKMSEIRPEMQLVVPGEYCHKCREFKPEVQESDIWANDRIVATARNIVCKNEALCRHLIDYLKQKE